MVALLDGLRFLEHHTCDQMVLVLGDSKLSINFKLQKYKPLLRELVLQVQEAQEMLWRWHATRVPRAMF